jgi:hypothetical protein
MPFSAPAAWFLIRIRSFVASVTPSTVLPFANELASVPAAVVATRTACFQASPAATAST